MCIVLKKTITSVDGTKNLAAELAEIFRPGDVICLNGSLGTGKTFLVKEICRNWGIQNAASPSFSIVNSYSGVYQVTHFDFYRIKKSAELYDIGFDEYIGESGVVIFIEWADMYEEILPKNCYNIKIQIKNGERNIEISKFS